MWWVRIRRLLLVACNKSLAEMDPEMSEIIEKEKARQWKGLELIPSENFTSASVMEAEGP